MRRRCRQDTHERSTTPVARMRDETGANRVEADIPASVLDLKFATSFGSRAAANFKSKSTLESKSC
jgi:hypothetical protein